MGNPRDHAARDISSKFSIFLPLRAIYFIPYHYETPCIMKIFLRLLNQVHDQNDEMKFLKALLSAEHAKLANFWSRVLQICTACSKEKLIHEERRFWLLGLNEFVLQV